MTRTITITSGKGGVGKTSLGVNLALQLSKLGGRTCLFDADLGLANINILLGLTPEQTLDDVLADRCSLHDILIRDHQGIDIIPGSSGVEKMANLGDAELARLARELATLDEYDYFLFDTAAGISRNVIAFCLASSEVVLVVTPEPTSLTDAYGLLKILCLNGFKGEVKVVLNLCKSAAIGKHAYATFHEVAKSYLKVSIPLLGVVRRDSKVSEAVKSRQAFSLLYPDSVAARCVEVVARDLMNEQPEGREADSLDAFWSRCLGFLSAPMILSGEEAAAARSGALHTRQSDEDRPAVDADIEAALDAYGEEAPGVGASAGTPLSMPAEPASSEQAAAPAGSSSLPQPPPAVSPTAPISPTETPLAAPGMEQLMARIEDLAREVKALRETPVPTQARPALSAPAPLPVSSGKSSFAATVREVVSFVLAATPRRCTLQVAETLWPGRADTGELPQTLCNLLFDLLRVLPAEGHLRVHGENLRIASGTGLPVAEGAYGRISLVAEGVAAERLKLRGLGDAALSHLPALDGEGQVACYVLPLAASPCVLVEPDAAGVQVHLLYPQAHAAGHGEGMATVLKSFDYRVVPSGDAEAFNLYHVQRASGPALVCAFHGAAAVDAADADKLADVLGKR